MLVVLAMAGSGLPAAQEGRGPLAVTYLANEGFLVEAAGVRVLVDALFRQGVSGYARLSDETRGRLESARAPYGGAAFALATHEHADHFDAASVAAYLAASPQTRFLTTPQAHARLQRAAGAATVRARAEGLLPAEGRRLRREHGGVRVDVLNIHHGRSRPTENAGFLVELGGWRVLHIGDSEATAADLAGAGVPAAKVDVFFVPYWYLSHDDGRRAVREAGARHVVVMHVGSGEVDQAIRRAGGYGPVFAAVRREFPGAIWLEREGQRVELR